MSGRRPGAGGEAGHGGGGLVVEGLGVCALLAAASQGLVRLAPGPPVGTTFAVLASAVVLSHALVPGAALLRARRAGDGGAGLRWSALGVRPGWTSLREGVVVAVVGLVVLGFLESAAEGTTGLSLGAPEAAAGETGRSLLGFVRDHPAWALVLATAAGVVEEVVYRGWGLLLVRRARPSLTVPALVVSSLLFGAAHVFVPVGGFVHYALIGLVFGCAALASASVVPGAVVHAGMNAAVMAAVVFGG